MFGRNAFLIILNLLLLACADPKYAVSTQPKVGNSDQKLEVCQARFASGHCVDYEWEKFPTETDLGSFIFKTFRPGNVNSLPVLEDLNGKYFVLLWMPSMGHGSSPVTIERLDIGTYRVSNVFFTMKGEWEIRFQIRDANEIKDQAIIPITL